MNVVARLWLLSCLLLIPVVQASSPVQALGACSGTMMKGAFTLLTFLYNEKKAQRCAEFVTCLEKNRQHHLVDKIHILYDTSCDDENNYLFKYLKTLPVSIDLIKGRPSFSDFVYLANSHYPNHKIIVANADIYFNETLNLLEGYDFSNAFFTLNRWDVRSDGSFIKRRCRIGYDVWMFATPLRFAGPSIHLGLPGCDFEIAYYAQKNGLVVTNPCLSIQCCHLHESKVRNYRKKETVYRKGPLKEIPITTL